MFKTLIFICIGLVIYAIYTVIKSIKTPFEKVVDNFRTIQPNIIGMTYDEIIDKLGQIEENRVESANCFNISYSSHTNYSQSGAQGMLRIYFEYNEENEQWVCTNYVFS